MTQYSISGKSASEIAASTEAAIELGELAPGAPLPAVRTLAEQLGVSPTTVSAALAELRSRGLIVTQERSRSRVSWRPPLAGALLRAGIPAGARDLASGNPDPELLPDLTPFLRRVAPPRQLYGDAPVEPRLLALARTELGSAGIKAESIAVVSGALDGVERALGARLRSGDLVAVEDPGFAGLYDLLRAMGLALRPVTVDERGMLPAALEAALEEGAAAVVVNPRGQNPTGAALDDERAAELGAVLDRFPEAMVVEDDHLGPVAGAPRVTLTGGRRRWAAALSVAKSLGPDLRLAVLAGDPQTISRVQGRQAVGPQWVSHLLQRLVAEMWSDPGVKRMLERAQIAYAERRERLVAALGAHGIESGAPTGINVWVPVPEEAPVVQSLLQDGWAVLPGGPYRLRSGRAIRVTASLLKQEEADDFAAALARALQPHGLTRTA